MYFNTCLRKSNLVNEIMDCFSVPYFPVTGLDGPGRRGYKCQLSVNPIGTRKSYISTILRKLSKFKSPLLINFIISFPSKEGNQFHIMWKQWKLLMVSTNSPVFELFPFCFSLPFCPNTTLIGPA